MEITILFAVRPKTNLLQLLILVLIRVLHSFFVDSYTLSDLKSLKVDLIFFRSHCKIRMKYADPILGLGKIIIKVSLDISG